jgi:hypothetical protein
MNSAGGGFKKISLVPNVPAVESSEPNSRGANFTTRLFLRSGGFGRFARVFVFRQAEIAHTRGIAGEGHAVAIERCVFELAPDVELFFNAGVAPLESG